MSETKKILVAEDETDLREAIVTVLTDAGYKVLAATNGQEALRLARQEHPDLLMLDIQMPNMNGLEVLKDIRQDEWGVKVPVIMLTAHSDIGNLSEAVSLGGTHLDYLTKTDWKLSDVVEKVKSKLGDPKAAE